MRHSLLLVRLLTAAAAAVSCCAPYARADRAAPPASFSLDEPAFDLPCFVSARQGVAPIDSQRGPTGQILFDSISGCGSFSRFGAAPAAILDDLSFLPGPASNAGGVVSGIDFYIRTWGARERINVRLTFYNMLDSAGSGSPLIVQHEMVSQQFLMIENAAVNLANPPGSYLITATLAPFVIHGATFALEIAFVDDAGDIVPNGALSTVFPGNSCVATEPVIGSSQDIFWIDNDNGNLTGDGIRYEPYDPAMPGNQGDALVWGGASPADNVLAVRIRGYPIESSSGACCLPVEPFTCTLQTAAGCATVGGLFVGLGIPCTPVFLCVPPPPNDLCDSAAHISGEGEFPFDSRGASSSGPDDCHLSAPPFGISSDVWFRWVAPCTGLFQLATCGRTVTDDRIAAYSGACDAISALGCDDDSCVTGFQSSLTLDATAGQVYLIRLGAYPNTPGGQGALGISRIDAPCSAVCVADYDHNGQVEVADIFAFLSAWFAHDPLAWFFGGSEGGVPSIFTFLSEWFARGMGPC